ncbi:MAG TPA: GAF domain-containing protein, partial [Anaerolineae bacterium]|nr:GAF domain-containing protein [Anaerolineae bacterium]
MKPKTLPKRASTRTARTPLGQKPAGACKPNGSGQSDQAAHTGSEELDWQSIAQQRAAELAIINSVGQGLARELDFQAIIDLVGDKIREIFEAKDMSIRLVGRGTNLIHFPYAFERGQRVKIDPMVSGIGFTDHVLRTRQPLVINHEMEQRAIEFGSSALPGTQTSTQSILVVPILAGDQAIGVICLEDERENAFPDSTVNLLTTLAANLGVALQNARRFDETRSLLKETDQRAAELALINSVQAGLASQLDFLSIVNLVGDKICEIFRSQDISIGLYDRASNILTMPYYVEGGKHYTIEPLPLSSGFSAHVLRTRQPLMINEHQSIRAQELGARLIGDLDNMIALDEQSYLGVPILKDDEAIGLVTLYANHTQAFTDAHVNLLQTLANSMSVALENARLFDETQRLLKETDQRAAELAIINSVQLGLASKLEFQSIIDLVGNKVQEIFAADTTYIALTDPRANKLHTPYYIDRGQRLYLPPSPLDGLTGVVAERRQPLLLNSAREAEAYNAVRLPSQGDQSQDLNETYLGVPMLIDGEVMA